MLARVALISETLTSLRLPVFWEPPAAHSHKLSLSVNKLPPEMLAVCLFSILFT